MQFLVLGHDGADAGALERRLAAEPYVTGKVWERVEVRPCRVGPSFARP